jgi:hypothetical protein
MAHSAEWPKAGGPQDQPRWDQPRPPPTHGQPAPGYGQPAPGYGQPPASGQPPGPGAPLVYGPPPSYGEPLRYPSEPPKKRRTGLKIALLVLAVLVVFGFGGGYLALRPILSQYPAKLTTPDTVVGMSRLTDPENQQLADKVSSELKSAAGADTTVAAFYAPNGDPDKAVALVGATHFIRNPASGVDDTFTGFSKGSDLTVTNLISIDPGPMGGFAKCGQAVTSGVALAICVWGDYGSVGIVVGYTRSIAETADLMRAIRPLVLHRG